MKSSIIGACAVLGMLCGPLAAQNLQPYRQTVETFRGTMTMGLDLPGTVTEDGIDFTGSGSVTSLAFDDSSTTWNGKSINFYGTEGVFLDSTYSGSGTVPNSPGQTVTVTGSVSAQGPAGGMGGPGTLQGVTLGDSFSASNFQIGVGSVNAFACKEAVWQDTEIVPELTGETVSGGGNETLTSIDPVSGVLTTSFTGNVFVYGPQPTEQKVGVAGDARRGFGLGGGLAVALLGLGMGGLGFSRPRIRD